MPSKTFSRLLCQVAVMLAIGSVHSLSSADQHAFENADNLNAADVLPAELLRGPHHRVNEVVRNDGYLNYYRIESDYGEFDAISTPMLKIRVGEINALAELDELSKTEVFLSAAADAGVGQLKSVKEFATRPVQSVVGIPSGIGRMFKRYSRQAGEAIDASKEFVAGDDEEDEGAADDADDDSTTDKVVDLTESYFGVSGAERAWSRKLGTDPYSSNEVLRAAIREVAWAERLGRFGMGFAGVPKIPGADIIGEVNDVVWSKDPYELEDLNRERLAATGATEALVESYLDSDTLSPTQQTLLTAAIAELDGADGRDGILEQALNVQTGAEANFLINTVTMLAWFHHNRMPIASVQTYSAVPSGIAQDGTPVLTFAVDHVYWTESIAEAARLHTDNLAEDRAGDAQILLLGSASDRTRQELNDLGYSVEENVAAQMVASDDA